MDLGIQEETMGDTALPKDMEFLQTARDDLEHQQSLMVQRGKQEEVLKNAEKVLNYNKKQVADKISKKVQEAKDEIDAFYMSQKGRKQEELGKVQTQRQKEKDAGMKKRIQSETKPLQARVKHIQEKRAELFKKNKVSLLWNSRVFYAFMFPSCIQDWALIFAFFFVYLLILPMILMNVVFHFSAMWQLALMYVILLAIFIGIYVLVLNRVKIPHESLFCDARKFRKEEHKKKREIQKLTKKIEKDKNEDGYDLEKYDDSIQNIKDEIEKIQKEWKQVLQEFDEQTKLNIAEEIRKENQERLLLLTDEREKAKGQLEEVQTQITEWNQILHIRYDETLGEGYMTEERIDALCEVLESGQAQTIEGAKQILEAGSHFSFQKSQTQIAKKDALPPDEE
jgi:hypothetical protein